MNWRLRWAADTTLAVLCVKCALCAQEIKRSRPLFSGYSRPHEHPASHKS